MLELRGVSFILGRSSDCDLKVETKEASRRHLALSIERGSLFVEDLHSANGTFVNGHRCRSRHELKTGDILGIASTEYVVLGPGESADRTMIRYGSQDAGGSFVLDENEGDLTSIVDRYPLPPDWPAEAESDIPADSLRGMERELDKRLIRDKLMDGAAAAALWRRQAPKGEELIRIDDNNERCWVIGRDQGCQVMLGDFSVSGEHARLELTNAGWQLLDLGSTNGTSVNGHAVEKRSALVTGDVITVGSVEMIFRALIKA